MGSFVVMCIAQCGGCFLLSLLLPANEATHDVLMSPASPTSPTKIDSNPIATIEDDTDKSVVAKVNHNCHEENNEENTSPDHGLMKKNAKSDS